MERLLTAMIEYDRGDAPRIQHFIKVYEFARIIGKMEKLDEHTQLPSLVILSMLSMFGSTCLALTFSARLASPATISVWISLGLVLMLW